ncbi:MAG: alpha/beta hydrolase [Methylibium sp.]|uniref:alpha/beta hydrolase n=1 Tax=Methylibium sp. TaxID=2067992 RepID=UPI00181A9D39|nr:alpha/beta hydrolase [Methylibium sp.]MBA3596933.1 alpha/beta hydrolase [Methylibium sp.]
MTLTRQDALHAAIGGSRVRRIEAAPCIAAPWLLVATAAMLAACASGPPASKEASSAVAEAPAAPNAQMQAVLDQLAAFGNEPTVNLSAPAARAQPALPDAMSALLQTRGRSTLPEVVARIENHLILGADATAMPVRVYWPPGDGPHPVLLYFHGGGWVLGDLEQGDAAARALNNAARAIVVAPQYRQGPEHRFPSAHGDAWVAYRWTLANAASFGGDPARVAVGGEGAGGNLAASVAIRARDERAPLPVHQLLVYPITDVGLDTPSHRQYIDTRPLGTRQLPWFFSQYLRSPIEGTDPAFSVLRTPDFAGLPAATVITAEIDPLRSQGQAYAERLRSAGVAVDYRNYAGVAHGFFGLGRVVDQANEAVLHAARGLRQAFGQP